MRRSVFAYPTMISFLGLAWVVPQGIELESYRHSQYASGAFWLYVTACFLFTYWGFKLGRRVKNKRMVQVADDELPSFKTKRLLIAAATMTAMGQIAILQIRGIDTSAMGGQWTGIVTMWVLLASANGFGLCLAVLVFARTQSRFALAIAIVATIPYLQAAFIFVRREAIFDLVILTAGAWYIAKNRTPPRIAIISFLLVGTVILNSVGDIRGRVATGETNLLGVLISESIYKNFNYLKLTQGSASEIGLAQYDFWHMNETWDWEYGTDYWNKLVHQYVPAFLVGRTIKNGLKVDTLSERMKRGENTGLFSLGSTRTGFSDSYRNFGVFGVLVFAAIGYFFGVLFAIALAGGISGQYFYLILLAEGLKAFTHSTNEFLAALPFALIVSIMTLRYAKTSSRSVDQTTDERSATFGVLR